MQQFIKSSNGVIASHLTRVFAIVLLALVAASPALAQKDEAEVVRKVEQAFSRGDAAALLAHAADRVEIAVLGTGSLYSRAQATYVLNDFFRENPPRRFAADEPSSTRDNFFVAGKYWYGADDQHYDVYMRFRWRDGTCEVRELRIERSAQ